MERIWSELCVVLMGFVCIVVGDYEELLNGAGYPSQLTTAQCRANCMSALGNIGARGEVTCSLGSDCYTCWDSCESIQLKNNWLESVCAETICFSGCLEACRFHTEIANSVPQSQPVIQTKDEAVIRIQSGIAKWPRPKSVPKATPLVFVVMRKSTNDNWRQITQTSKLSTRVSYKSGTTLKILVIGEDGLLAIYSPEEVKRQRKVNTERKALRVDSTNEKWTLKEGSLIHQHILVIAELSWEPKEENALYLVTWEINGGGLKGNLFTHDTHVNLSLWPDTLYHIQVELVSHLISDGRKDLKSEMLDLDTSKAQYVRSEETDRLQDGAELDERESNRVDSNRVDLSVDSLDSVEVKALKDEKVRARMRYAEYLLGSLAALVVFLVVLVVMTWCFRKNNRVIFCSKPYEFLNIKCDSEEKIAKASHSSVQPVITVITDKNVFEHPYRDCQSTEITRPSDSCQTSAIG